MRHFNRRIMVQSMGGLTLGAVAPRLALADADTDARLVLVILRGALDGLAAVPAYGDGYYARQRGELAITAPERRLDGLFALHPELAGLYARYQAGELLVLHAAATPYRERSHFDGQDALEAGSGAIALRDGWLNRALPALPPARRRPTAQLALALAQNVPLVLRGGAAVGSWAPSRLPEADSDTLQRVADLYAGDPYFAGRLQAALAAEEVAGAAAGRGAAGRRNPLGAITDLAAAAGRFLAAADGPRIAVLEAGGWDTHANQGAERGQLATRLRGLDQGLEGLRTALGPAWRDTVVVVATEFGRTVAVNGTRGTDHGTATCAFLVGGAVAGGRVITDWPGLAGSALREGRDLAPTLDLRSVFKGVLGAHLGVPERELEERVFPGSRRAAPLDGLTRAVRIG
jgi:uncharacterized protein (DUF1501 family)